MMRFTLPWPEMRLSTNGRRRLHRFQESRLVKARRAKVGWQCKALGLRKLDAERVSVSVTFHPPDRRSRDDDGIISAWKCDRDALADAIGVDDARWSVRYAVGDVVKGGAVVVEVGEG